MKIKTARHRNKLASKQNTSIRQTKSKRKNAQPKHCCIAVGFSAIAIIGQIRGQK